MNYRIYKYTLEVRDEQAIEMPQGARLLSVQVQHGKPCLWALVDPDALDRRSRRIAIRGTGHDAGHVAHRPFVGTFQLEAGAFVGHVFDLGETE